jgi:hypothetical protein
MHIQNGRSRTGRNTKPADHETAEAQNGKSTKLQKAQNGRRTKQQKAQNGRRHKTAKGATWQKAQNGR